MNGIEPIYEGPERRKSIVCVLHAECHETVRDLKQTVKEIQAGIVGKWFFMVILAILTTIIGYFAVSHNKLIDDVRYVQANQKILMEAFDIRAITKKEFEENGKDN